MINRREFLIAPAVAAAAPQGRKQPNILHLQSDQQQWATIAGRSPCRTPNLNRLASGGMLFERSYTPSAVCCPSRAMTLSGAYHWHNGVYNQIHSSPSVHRDLDPDAVLYSQPLREAGYRQGYVGKWHCSWLRSPLDFGFDEVANMSGCDPRIVAKLNNNPDRLEQRRGQLKPTTTRSFRWPGSPPFAMWGHHEGPEEATPEAYTADCAIAMMDRFSKGSQSWHLEVHWTAPHDAYMPLKKYLNRYDPRSIQVPGSFRDSFANKPGLHRREAGIWADATEEDVRVSRAHYYAYTEQLDAQVGRVLDALDRSGQAENTLVVFTTDHGDMVGAHHMWIKGWIPYEECYRVPMIARWPGTIQAGGRCDHLVQLHDLAHTYVQAGGAKSLPYPDGRSLTPLFADPNRSDWSDDILCAYYGGEFLYTQRIAISQRYKYVFNGFDFDELYDLERDPEEMRNVADTAEYRGQTADMRQRLWAMMNRFEDPYGDVKARNSIGNAPDRYGAARYLQRG